MWAFINSLASLCVCVLCVGLLTTAKQPPEATLRGHEYLFYDMAQNGGEPIVSSSDEISLYFKTRQANGMLFYTGTYSAAAISLSLQVKRLSRYWDCCRVHIHLFLSKSTSVYECVRGWEGVRKEDWVDLFVPLGLKRVLGIENCFR